jgi:trehalose-6-phosphatase
MQVCAILSDYDGTLCPTTSIRNGQDAIPEELENILWDISEKIPVCIISSKDFDFLHNKTRFANVISCILGIETLACLTTYLTVYVTYKVKISYIRII